jgi:hypothetical protein
MIDVEKGFVEVTWFESAVQLIHPYPSSPPDFRNDVEYPSSMHRLCRFPPLLHPSLLVYFIFSFPPENAVRKDLLNQIAMFGVGLVQRRFFIPAVDCLEK